MKAATQSCSGKKCSQNLDKILKKHPQRSPFSSKTTGVKPAGSLTKKKKKKIALRRHTQALS